MILLIIDTILRDNRFLPLTNKSQRQQFLASRSNDSEDDYVGLNKSIKTSIQEVPCISYNRMCHRYHESTYVHPESTESSKTKLLVFFRKFLINSIDKK